MAKKAAAQAPDPYAEDREIPQEEQDAVKKLLAQVERAKLIRKKFDEETLPSLRRYTWGTKTGEQAGAESSTRTNLIFATLATLLPHIYAKNPEIAVAPTEAVGENEYENIKQFCKTAQTMLNNLFIEEAKLKRRAKANIRSAMTTSVGWLKMGFQKSLAGDPIIVGRANDVQDNLRRIEYLISCTKKETDLTKLNEQRSELQLQLKTVMDSPEMKIFKGFVLDRVKTEDVFILDESIVEFDNYPHAKRIAHRIWMTDEEYTETFGHDVPKGSTLYGQPAAGEFNDDSGSKINISDAQKASYRAVFEVWDKTSNTICCVCEGVKGYSKPPYILKPASERWYSFYALGFNIVEGRWRPLSDVELLTKLQDEYNTTRYLFAETRKEAIPVRFFRKTGNIEEEDLKNFANRKARDILGIGGNPSTPLANDIMQLEGLKIDPAAYDVSIIRNDMDMLVGLSDASRANLIEAKTATEAEIMRQALQNRVAERQDSVEDMTSEMANSALEIMLQEFKLDEVKQIVGEGAVWPELEDIETIFRKVRVSVRAGSTGKPNVIKERESWAQIMPIINETITQVMELRMQGQEDLANSKIELLKETLTRYDEKIDVDRFIPKQEMGEDGKPVAQANMMAQAAQMQEQFQALQEEHAKMGEELKALEQQLLIAKQNDQTTAAKAQSDGVVAVEAERSKAAESQARTAETAAKEARQTEVEKFKISEDRAQAAADAQAEREFKEYQALLDAATKLVAAEITAAAKPKEEGAEGEPSGNGKIKPEAVPQMMKGFMDTLGQMVDAMKGLAGPRSVTIKKGEDGTFSGESKPARLN